MSLTTGTRGIGPAAEDFAAIEEAVMETPRGRWFLTEYASKIRSRDTLSLLETMRRLEAAVSSNHDAIMTRLVQALAQPQAPAAPERPADIAPRHMKYFKRDEEIFEPPSSPKLETVKEPEPAEPKGAKLIVRRHGETVAAAETPMARELPALEPAPAVTAAFHVETATPEPVPAETQPKRRIVIIRHKPGETIDVPMQNAALAEAS